MFKKPNFPPEAIQAAKTHALKCWPEESCGIIISGVYVPCENMAADKNNNFRISSSVILAAGNDLEAVIHSHADGYGAPTAADMQGQINSGVVWGIIPCIQKEAFDPVFFGDFRLEEPLLGREFLHGVTDCYSLIRAYYWQEKKVKLLEFPRDDQWWKNGGDLYREGFQKAGFKKIEQEDVQPGDVFLGGSSFGVPYHGGIILENGLILHHFPKRLSLREPIIRWAKSITHFLRYEG